MLAIDRVQDGERWLVTRIMPTGLEGFRKPGGLTLGLLPGDLVVGCGKLLAAGLGVRGGSELGRVHQRRGNSGDLSRFLVLPQGRYGRPLVRVSCGLLAPFLGIPCNHRRSLWSHGLRIGRNLW